MAMTLITPEILMDVKETYKNYTDRYGCLVLKDAMEGGQAGVEDSCHHSSLYVYACRFLNRPDLCSHIKLTNFYDGADFGIIRRHPRTQYSTSRDQALPLFIALNNDDRKYLDKEYLAKCEVQKASLKKWSWIIRLFRHTTNGDVFQPCHDAVVDRATGRAAVWWRRPILWFQDLWSFGNTLCTIIKPSGSDVVMGYFLTHFAANTTPTLVSKFNHWLFCKCVDVKYYFITYFDRPSNPPVNSIFFKLMEK